MNSVESAAVIPVNLHVTRYQVYEDDDMVEVWGYVGDYEVCVYLPLAEAREKGLVARDFPVPSPLVGEG